MGSPPGPFRADVLERVIMYKQYVYDTFVMTENFEEATVILQEPNRLHPNILFTMEPEIENTLNFLDIGMRFRTTNPESELKTQYRMHPELPKFSNSVFYDNRIENGVSAVERKACSRFPWPDANNPTFCYAVRGEEDRTAEDMSCYNPKEAESVKIFVVKYSHTPDSYINCWSLVIRLYHIRLIAYIMHVG
ncbi:unnamed protein product [Echinostoma caproni]|uniref:AAA_12 domain-containing protein n=1 Tax=Echinostoma caproni TaxID=27848 RepID=A0A183AWF4_9TREM|nr:unnamed protein product [Echinostoma caproni]